MSAIHIASTPRQSESIFDPTTAPIASRNFSLLRSGNTQNGNVGGRFALPREFDSSRFASSFVAEGNEVESMAGEQPVMGTGYVADGWTVWKYPTKGKPVVDENFEPVLDKAGQPTFEEHPSAGKTHRISSQERGGPTYVLMCRPIEVQKQVNEVYGLLSIDNMTAEVRGETVAGQDPATMQSMLTERQLKKAEGGAIDADRAYEEGLGQSKVVHSSLTSTSERLTKPSKKVSK